MIAIHSTIDCTSMTSFSYYDYKITLATKQVEAEIAFLEPYAHYPETKEYLEYLRSRIGKPVIVGKYTAIVAPSYKNLDPTEYNKNMDELMFKKPWKNLNLMYKGIKIKQYIESLETDNKQELIDAIMDGIKEKRFTANKNKIEYDSQAMVITSISCLVKVDDGYVIEWSGKSQQKK